MASLIRSAVLSDSEQAIFDKLQAELVRARFPFDTADAYYDGAQRLEQLGLAIPDELMRFAVIVNWPRVVADAHAERLEVKGFRLANDSKKGRRASELWKLWTTNGMAEQDMLSRLEFQIYGRTYRCVGTNEDDEEHPLITVESPREIITDRDPRTRKVVAALRLFNADPDMMAIDGDRSATLYLPNQTITLENDGGWWVTDRDEHDLGVVPVVPTFRRRRTTIPAHRTLQGVSVMEDVIPVTDSAARALTNAQVAQEVLAVPQRGVLGATKGDFIDKDGKALTAWEAYFGAVWAIGSKDAKTFQFDAADMKNFETLVNMYARLASGVSGLPPNYFGLAADDAASADAIRSRLDRLIKACEWDQLALGAGDAELMRIAYHVRDGKPAEDLIGLETLWHDAGTPTYASRADAVVKQYSATDSSGMSLLPAEMAYEELGWGPSKIRRALKLREQEQRRLVSGYVSQIDDKDAADATADAA